MSNLNFEGNHNKDALIPNDEIERFHKPRSFVEAPTKLPFNHLINQDPIIQIEHKDV